MNKKYHCKLVSKDETKKHTTITIGNKTINRDQFTIIAGPCSVESEKVMYKAAEKLIEMGINFLRAGAYKPRCSPYAFQGSGAEGLKILKKIKRDFDLKIVTEVIDCDVVDEVSEVADILQVGARNMSNTSLLKKVGKKQKPILLKRGMSATIEEFLLAAEYILLEGNQNVILCERGIRTFNTHCRNTLDVAAIAKLKSLTYLPIFADPSHSAGIRSLVTPLAKSAVSAGANGIIVEAHPTPDKALSDAEQTIDLKELSSLKSSLEHLFYIVN